MDVSASEKAAAYGKDISTLLGASINAIINSYSNTYGLLLMLDKPYEIGNMINSCLSFLGDGRDFYWNLKTGGQLIVVK